MRFSKIRFYGSVISGELMIENSYREKNLYFIRHHLCQIKHHSHLSKPPYFVQLSYNSSKQHLVSALRQCLYFVYCGNDRRAIIQAPFFSASSSSSYAALAKFMVFAPFPHILRASTLPVWEREHS